MSELMCPYYYVMTYATTTLQHSKFTAGRPNCALTAAVRTNDRFLFMFCNYLSCVSLKVCVPNIFQTLQ